MASNGTVLLETVSAWNSGGSFIMIWAALSFDGMNFMPRARGLHITICSQLIMAALEHVRRPRPSLHFYISNLSVHF